MKQKRFILFLVILSFIFTLQAVAVKISCIRHDDTYVRLPYSSFKVYDLSQLLIPYKDKESISEISPPAESTPKKPFKNLYKYVTPDEINELDTIIKDVPLIGQFPNYPTGCESVAAVTLLRYYGIDIDIDSFIDNNLSKSFRFYNKDGKMFGPNPNEHFVGDPRKESSWGCMSPVISKAITEEIGENKVELLSDKSLEYLCENYIDNGDPVIVWVSIHMLNISHNAFWYFEDGTKFYWPSNEHTMILIGYDDWYYYFSDPYVPAVVRYTKELSSARYETMGKQAVAIKITNK